MTDRRVRVATLNIWHDRGPWPDRLRLIRRELADLRPAVLALQEVLEGQAAAVAEDLGYEVTYGPATETDDGRLFGNALLSSEPIRDSRTYRLPGADRAEPRSLLHTVIGTPHGDLPVFVTHLAWEFDHSPLRQEQTASIAERIAELAPEGAVLMGDFNAEPDSPEIRSLGAAGFADAWQLAGDGTAGSTFARANGFALEADEPDRRIDYVFVHGGRHRIQGTRLVFTEPDRTQDPPVWPSDHYGLVTDLALENIP